MPDYTVKADVDTMLRANDKAAIRSAIGVGQTDAPTFLAQTLTGQSLTGTQATSLVDLVTTWNTTGNPSLIYGRVTNTNSGTTANLIDLGTLAGGSQFSVSKIGNITIPYANNRVFNNASGANGFRLLAGPFGGDCLTIERGDFSPMAMVTDAGFKCIAQIGFIPNIGLSAADTFLVRDGAAGILAQRNGTAKQVHRVYNTFLGTTANEWGGFDWLTTTNTLRIGTEHGGTGQARSIDFVTGGVVRMSIGATGGVTVSGDLIGSNSVRIGSGAGQVSLFVGGSGILRLVDTSFADFGRLQLGGTTSAFPAIKRNGTGIDIRLADDSAFAPLAAAKLDVVGSTGDILLLKNAAQPVLTVNSSGGSGSIVINHANTPSVVINQSTGNKLTIFPGTGNNLQSANSSNVGIDLVLQANGGNTGIGAISPASKLTVTNGDVEVATIASGLILKSPDGTRYRVTVPNGGTVLTITAV